MSCWPKASQKSKMRRLRSFLQLSPTDRGLLISATVLLVTARLALWVSPLRVVRAFVARLAGSGELIPHGGERFPVARIVWAVETAGRHLPACTCLSKALVAQSLLWRHGYSTKLQIGVVKGSERSIKAHAWLEHDGMVVIGGPESELRGYALLSREGYDG